MTFFKECGGCGKSKNMDDFHNSNQTDDGKQARCKECQRAYRLKKRSEKNAVVKPKVKKTADMVAYRREYNAAHREQINKQKTDWWRRNRDRESVRNKTRYAIRVGKLVRQPCSVCGAVEVEAHHTDYSKPLEVVWLCHTHHLEAHGKVDPKMQKDVANNAAV